MSKVSLFTPPPLPYAMVRAVHVLRTNVSPLFSDSGDIPVSCSGDVLTTF